MSGAIKINGTSSGSTTITAPASGADETIELSTALAAKWNSTVSDTAPSSPTEGDVWVDTTGATTVAKMWNGSAWAAFSARATYSATTGSPTITTVGSKQHLKWIGDGTVTIDNAGFVTMLIVAGGGGGSATSYGGAGGGGSAIEFVDVWLSAGTHTIKVGAGGAATANGGISKLSQEFFALGGSNGVFSGSTAADAGSCGGGGTGQSGILTGRAGKHGGAGGNGELSGSGGGGGGFTGNGQNGASGVGGTGGTGTTSTLADGTTSVGYGGGGGGGGNTDGAGTDGGGNGNTNAAANRGGGAGGGGTATSGGSGLVALVIG